MKTRFYNARIMSMVDGEQIFEGEIHVEGSEITYVGKACATPSDFDKSIDCKGNLLMPGFKNAHTHSGMTVLRSLADDKALQEWLTQDIFPVEANMTYDDIYWMSQLAALEYLTSGITACFDMYLDNAAMAKAMDDMGFRCVQVGGVNDFSDDVTKIDRIYDEINGKSELQSYILGYHAEYTTSLENHRKIAEIAQRRKAPLYVHACETKSEVEDCKKHYGMTPVQFMDSLGMFNFGGGIYHGVWMSEEDLKVMKERGLYVVTNPASNLKLASGIAPLKEYVERGIPVAIGTDGPASNNCLDFFREMFLAVALAKVRENDPTAVDACEVLKMATVNGAKAMLLNDCDVLAPGKKADIIMIDLMQPNMQPINNIEKNLVYSGSKQNVKMTMINGRILYQDGCFLSADPEEIYKKVEEIKARLL